MFLTIIPSALSFVLVERAYDKATEWTFLSARQRATVKAQYAAAGIKLIVSLFGSTDYPTTNGADPIKTADRMAAWVKQYDLDGVDVDYEVRFFLFFSSVTPFLFTWCVVIRTLKQLIEGMERQKHGLLRSLGN